MTVETTKSERKNMKQCSVTLTSTLGKMLQYLKTEKMKQLAQ